MSRKRRRSQAFQDEADDEGDISPSALDDIVIDQDAANEAKHNKAVEIWEAFKEEFHEPLEQLPTALERYMNLLKEQDVLAVKCADQLLPALRGYVTLRQSAVVQPPSPHAQEMHDSTSNQAPDALPPDEAGPSANGIHSATSPNVASPAPSAVSANGAAVVSTPAALGSRGTSSVPPQSKATRELLMRITSLAEEHLRASEEKVSLAQAAFDSVERQIRLLEAAIQEQEASLSLGMRPGTHPSAIVLPDVVPPTSTRQTRAAGRSGPIDTADDPMEMLDAPSSDVPDVPSPAQARSTRGRRKKGHRDSGGASDFPSGLPNSADQANPDEEKYCICERPSFGEMIACDNKKCSIEWFHLGCVGLDSAPKGRLKWYCGECLPLFDGRKKGSRMRS